MVSGGVRVERADDWQALHRLLYPDIGDGVDGQQRATEVFRGHTNRAYPLTTSLQRFVGESGQWDVENDLLRNFNKYAQQFLAEPESFHHILSLAQHHGLPTRLLDWTYSPLVATYFATGGDPATDGEVLVVDYVRAHEHLPPNLQTVLARANTRMLDIDLLEAGIEILLQEAGMDVTAARVRTGSLQMLEIREVVAAYVDAHGDPYAMFFEPPPIDQRIANQAALFASWFPANPAQPMDEWLEAHPEFFRRVVIPAERKREFRARLDRSNVNHRTLFPGLDGLSTWLAENHRPPRPAA